MSIPDYKGIDTLDKERALQMAYTMLVRIGNGESYPIQEYYARLIAIEKAIGIEHKE